jgi:hypothetical protein
MPTDERAGWRQRFERALSELRESPDVRLVRERIQYAAGPVDEDLEDELREECDAFELDDAMRSLWSAVDAVDVEWAVGEGAGGRIVVPELLDLARAAFLEDGVVVWDPEDPESGEPDPQAYLARDDDERRFLLELHHLECRESAHWTALRVRADAPVELWYRRDVGEGAVDLRLDADVATYFETMLHARGADGWPVLLVSREGLDPRSRRAVDDLGRQLEGALAALARIPAAREDAERLSARLAARRA